MNLPFWAAAQNFSVSGLGCGDAIVLVSDIGLHPFHNQS